MEVRNIFKGLDLIDRVPEELWMEVCDIVQEAVIKTILKKKRFKKTKWLPEEALQTAEKKREMQGRGKKEKYTHLNAEFQRIARRDNHAKMGTVKDRNGMDPTEAEDIKKRWQEYTEELYEKGLHNPDNHDGVIIHLRARHPRMQSQVGLRKYHYKQS